MVPFRPGVHALPSCAGVVDESGFSDLPEEAIVAKSSSDPHTEYRWGVLCMLRHNMFVEGVGFILPPEAICVLLSSVVGVVGSLSNVDVTITTAVISYVTPSLLHPPLPETHTGHSSL